MKLLVIVLMLIFFPVRSALAQCTGPSGVEGQIVYNSSHNVPQYCDGTDWIAMTGADPATSVQGPKEGLVGYWKLDETSGTTAVDATGNNDGTMQNGLDASDDSTTGTVDRALRFDGVDDFILVGSPIVSGAPFTVCAWIHLDMLPSDSGDEFTIFSMTDGQNNLADFFNLRADDGSDAVQFNVKESSTGTDVVQTTATVTPGQWQHYCAVAAANDDRTVYLDAGNAGTSSTSRSPVVTGTLIGAHDQFGSTVGDNVDDYTNGKIDDLRVYNRALSANEVEELYNLPPSYNLGLVGHWRLDETSGMTALDSSENGNDGTYSSDILGSSENGIIGSAVAFTDGGFSASVPYDSSLDIATPTLSAWFKHDHLSQENATLAGRRLSVWAYPWSSFVINHNGDSVKCSASEGQGGDSFGTNSYTLPSADVWTHAACVYDGSNLILYIDGKIHDSTAFAGPIGYDPEPFLIANTGGNGRYDGAIDDVRFYDRPLSAGEMREIYEARDGIRYNGDFRMYEYFDGNKYVSMTPPWPDVTEGLVGHWKLDETEGTTAFDSSGNGLSGALQNGMDASNESTQGAIGSAFVFRGNGPEFRVDVPNDPSFQFGSAQDFATSFWLKGDVISEEKRLLVTHNGGSTQSFMISVDSSGHALPRIRDGVNNIGMTSTSSLIDENWHHLVVNFDRDGDMSVYIDGFFDASTDISIVGDISNSLPLLIGGRTNGSNNFFNGAIDDVRIYDRLLTADEIQQIYNMGTPVGSSTALPQGCPEIGDVCDDGSIYAGLSPDGNVEMYTTPQSVSGGTASWNNGGSNWVTTNIDNDDTGEANTAALVTIDSDSGAAGFQTHESAQHCYDLKQHGSDDWYLPATNELQLLYDNLVDADNSYNFDLFQNQSSSERSSNTFHCIDFSNGSGCGPLKDRTRSFRCVRKGPAPRCANPYGVEGQMVYNGDYDVVQFCDGARWRAVGKYGP